MPNPYMYTARLSHSLTQHYPSTNHHPPQDPDDPYKDAYDEEVVLLFTDQNSESGEEELKALQEVRLGSIKDLV